MSSASEQLNNKAFIKNILIKNGAENPDLEIRIIEELRLNSNDVDDQIMHYLEIKKPIQYLSNYTYVNNHKIYVDQNTLIPGIEMQYLIGICKNYILQNFKIIELCTGCGGISTLLGMENDDLTIFATDISADALNVAYKNKENYMLKNVNLLLGDLFEPIHKQNICNVDMIIANPPYCKTESIISLPTHLNKHTPHIAIDGGSEGLYFYRKIMKEACNYLKSDGFIIFQHDDGQGIKIKEILLENKFNFIRTYKNHFEKEVFSVAKLESA